MQTTTTAFTAEVDEYLRDHFSLTISTSSFTGFPHANTAPFANDDRLLYFFAPEDSALLKNMAANRNAAFTVDDYSPTWRKQRELHGTGQCGLADESMREASYILCTEKLGEPLPEGALCWLEPVGMYFIDY